MKHTNLLHKVKDSEKCLVGDISVLMPSERKAIEEQKRREEEAERKRLEKIAMKEAAQAEKLRKQKEEKERKKREQELAAQEAKRAYEEECCRKNAQRKKRIRNAIYMFAIISVLSIVVFIVCKQISERVETSYNSAVLTMESGDFERAFIQFDSLRNNWLTPRDYVSKCAEQMKAMKEADVMITEGDNLYAICEYEQAETKYESAMCVSEFRRDVSEKYEKASQCSSNLIYGELFIRANNYTSAKLSLSELYELHPTSKNKERISECQNKEKEYNTMVAKQDAKMRNRVNGHDFVDLGLSVKWATCNIGATSPEDYGNYYAWGENITKFSYSMSTYCSYADMSKKYNCNGMHNLDAIDDVATCTWGGDWKMPSRGELDELLYKCSWTWTTRNGVYGYIVYGKNHQTIFLPAAGYYDESLNGAGEYCYYWTNDINFYGNGCAAFLHAMKEYKEPGLTNWYFGLPIRPVLK